MNTILRGSIACVLAGLAAPVCADELAANQYDLEIERLPIVAALTEFSRQTGLQVGYLPQSAAEERTVVAPLKGQYTAESALQQLLGASGLAFEKVNDRTIAVTSARPTFRLARSGGRVMNERVTAVYAAETSPGGAGAAPAQSDEAATKDRRKIEEVIVTATKREERLQDIPMSIAAISTEDIERRGFIGMEDYLREIPGVNQIDFGPSYNAIVIRGITTSPELENFVAGGPTVATYFGETAVTAAGGLGRGGVDIRPVDIERIEVLRGPQGTAYGGQSLGGTLRIIPAKPQLDHFSARFTASLSSTSDEGGDNSMLQGVVNLPLSENKFGIRLVGYRYDDSGYYRNNASTDPALNAVYAAAGLPDYLSGYSPDDQGRIVSTGGRLAARWQVSDKMDLTLTLLTQTLEQDGQSFEQPGRPKWTNSRAPVYPEIRQRGELAEINDFDMDLANLVWDYDLGWASLLTSLSWISAGGATVTDQSVFFPVFTDIDPSFDSFSTEARLVSQFDGRFQFLAGVYYEDTDDHYYQRYSSPLGAANPWQTDPILTYDVLRQFEQEALFAELSYDLTDKLTATIGGRYFQYDRTDEKHIRGGLFGDPVDEKLDDDGDDSTLKANISYQPTADVLLYASWAQGFRLPLPTTGAIPGTCDLDEDGVVDGTGVTIESTRHLDPDVLEQYELGGKFTLLEQRLVLNAAVYHIDWDEFPMLFAPAQTCNFPDNVGKATSEGVEFQASLLVLDGLRVNFGAGYTSAELAKDAPLLPGSPKDGARLPGSAETTANLGAQFDFEIGGYSAFVRADSFYTGEFEGDLIETPTLKAGDYVKIDARAGITIKSLSMEVFVRNLTNEDAYTWRSVALTDFRLRPRTVGIQLGYNFQ